MDSVLDPPPLMKNLKVLRESKQNPMKKPNKASNRMRKLVRTDLFLIFFHQQKSKYYKRNKAEHKSEIQVKNSN
ncbi:hypothetical protein PJP13_29525, partial [Mycobacterium kansasii]